MPTYQGLSAWIEIDGHRQPEYEVKDINEDGSIVCVIPSIVNKSFTICVHDEDRELDTGCCLTLDGEPYAGKVIFRCEEDEVPDKPSSRVKGFQPDRYHFQPFQFANVILLDDEENGDVGSHKLGQIEVLLSEVKYKKIKDRSKKVVPARPRRVSEQVAKNLSHCVALGPVEKLQDTHPEGDLDAVKVTKYVRELVNFVFTYRPLKHLIAERIASPSITVDSEVVSVAKVLKTPHTPSTLKRALTFDSDVDDADYTPASRGKKTKTSPTESRKPLKKAQKAA